MTLGGPALIVEAHDGPVRPGQRAHDEADPGEQLTKVMLDLRDHAAGSVPGGGLVLEAAVADQRRVARSAAWPRQQILDLTLQHIIGRQPDRVVHPAAFQSLVDLGPGERGARPDYHPLSASAVPINDGQQDLVPSLGAMDIARSEFRDEAVALGVEDESFDQRAHAEAFVQLAREKQSRIGRDRGTAELDAKLRIERELDRTRFRVTHWMMPSAPARPPGNLRFSRALNNYGPVDSALKMKMRASYS